MEDENGLELSLGLSCGGLSVKSKGKNGSSSDARTEEGDKGNKLVDDFKNFLHAGTQKQDSSTGSQRNDSIKVQENFFNDLSKNNTEGDSSMNLNGRGVWAANSNKSAEMEDEKRREAGSKRKMLFDEINHQKKQERDAHADLHDKTRTSHISITTEDGRQKMKMFVSHSDLRAMTLNATGLRHHQGLHPVRSDPRRQSGYYRIPHLLLPVRPRAVYGIALEEKTKKKKKNDKKPAICTADELHHVSVPNSDWTLALWRYLPSPQAQPRNHPLLLLSGVATNAIGYDLSPESSFAHYMSGQGFDTWVLELRGAGLSTRRTDFKEVGQPLDAMVDSSVKSGMDGVFPSGRHSTFEPAAFTDSDISIVNRESKETVSKSDDLKLVTKFMETFSLLSEKLAGFLNGGSLEVGQNSAIASQIRVLSQGLANIIEEGQLSVPTRILDLQGRFSTTLDEFQKQLDLIVKYDWDFDSYLEEDLPAAVEYIRTSCEPKDGKLLAIGHSMGGILLYAMLSRCCFEGRNPGFAAVATLGSSLDYTTSKSSLKLLLPLADPVQALNVPVIPIGALLAAAHPLTSRPPYVLSWLNAQISAQHMMHPKLFEKLVLNNFGTVPTKLLLQLATAFQEGGLRDRSGSFFFKDHLHKSSVPVLALAGDQDLICPPEAVNETVKLISEDLVAYKVFGEPGGAHYGHYDLVGGRLIADQVYPCIVEFLNRHDKI